MSSKNVRRQSRTGFSSMTFYLTQVRSHCCRNCHPTLHYHQRGKGGSRWSTATQLRTIISAGRVAVAGVLIPSAALPSARARWQSLEHCHPAPHYHQRGQGGSRWSTATQRRNTISAGRVAVAGALPPSAALPPARARWQSLEHCHPAPHYHQRGQGGSHWSTATQRRTTISAGRVAVAEALPSSAALPSARAGWQSLEHYHPVPHYHQCGYGYSRWSTSVVR